MRFINKSIINLGDSMFKFSASLRKIIYATNAIESLNSALRKLSKNRSVFPSEKALLKATYLATERITRAWTKPLHGWTEAVAELQILFPNRFGID